MNDLMNHYIIDLTNIFLFFQQVFQCFGEYGDVLTLYGSCEQAYYGKFWILSNVTIIRKACLILLFLSLTDRGDILIALAHIPAVIS